MRTGQSHFELLGVEPRFDLDVDVLEHNYRERSKEVHPDRHVGASANERTRALQASMQLNDAVKTLSSPVRRAEYLLGLHGVTISESERLEPALIMDILDKREELSEALARGDRDELDSLEESMLDRKDEILARVAALFDRGTGPEELAAIKRELILLRYVDRYLEQFDERDDDDLAAATGS